MSENRDQTFCEACDLNVSRLIRQELPTNALSNAMCDVCTGGYCQLPFASFMHFRFQQKYCQNKKEGGRAECGVVREGHDDASSLSFVIFRFSLHKNIAH